MEIIEPQKYKNVRGNDLFGYPPQEMSNAINSYNFSIENFDFEKANQILFQLKLTLSIEELAVAFRHALFKNVIKPTTDFTNLREFF